MFVNRRAKFLLILISPLAIFVFPIFLSAFSVSDIVINEIMYDFAGTDDKHEWIELYNVSGQEVDLTDWKFNDGSNHGLNIPPENKGQGSMIIPIGGYVILAGDADTFLSDHPAFSGTVIDTVMNLNNTTDTLKLLDKDDNEVISLSYFKEWGANGDGKTLEKIDPEAADIQSNWKGSMVDGGTPGAQNGVSGGQQQEEQIDSEITSTPDSGATQTNQPPKAEAGPDIIALINQEIAFDASKSSDPENAPLSYFWNFGNGQTSDKIKITHSYKYPGKYIATLTASDGQSSNTDTLTITIYSNSISISEFMPNPEGKDEENEWIELFNSSSQAVDISGWKIDTGEDKKAFSLPTNSLVAGYQYLVLARPTTKISLNNTSGKVRLIYPTGQVAQEIKYDKAPQGQSVSLVSGNQYSWSASPTPGTTNIISASTNKSASQLNSVITEAQENNSPLSSIIPSAISLFTNQPPPTTNTIIDESTTSSTVGDNLLINQGNQNGSANSNNNNNPIQAQSAAISKLFQNKFSSAITIIVIIAFGLVAGLGLAFLRRRIKN